MSVRRDGHPRWKGGAQCGQAIVELALVLPVLLLLTMGVLGVGRITQAHMAVRAVAWEAARAAALAPTSTAAAEQGLAAGLAVADAYHLQRAALQLTVDGSDFRRGGDVNAVARYDVSLADVPMLGRTGAEVQSQHREPVDPYRSGIGGGTS